MKKRIIGFISLMLVLSCIVTICSCGKINGTAENKKTVYLPEQKTFHCRDSQNEFLYTANYQWENNKCVMTINDFRDNTSVSIEGKMGYTLSLFQITGTYDESSKELSLEFVVGEVITGINVFFDNNERITKCDFYEKYGQGESFSNEDAVKISYENDGVISITGRDFKKYIDSTITVNTDDHTAIFKKAGAEVDECVARYSDDGHIWSSDKNVICDFFENGALRTLIDANGFGIKNTEQSDIPQTFNWQKYCDLFIDYLMYGFMFDWYDNTSCSYIGFMCVSAYIQK